MADEEKPVEAEKIKGVTAEEVEKWKALARKHEAQAKANAEAAKKLVELEEAGKGETQKAAERAAAAETRAEKAEARLLRLEVGGAKGLTPKQAERLQGVSREELEADAAALLEDFKPAGNGKAAPPPGGKPTERLEGGGDPTEEPEEMDPRKLAAGVSRG